MRRVAVTGIGLATALGTGTEPTWSGLIEGRSGIDRITAFDPSSLRTQIGGEIRDFKPQEHIANRRTLRMMTRGDQLGVVGAALAVSDSQLDMSQQDGDRAGLFVGSNKEVSDLDHLLQPFLDARGEVGVVDIRKFGESASTTAYPLFYVEGLQHATLFFISQAYDLRGANTYFAGTAESGASAIGRGFRAVRRGEVDLALTGGYDDAVSWWNMTKMDTLGYMTDRNDLGAAACRPYDRNRCGTVLGEGAAFLMLEDLETAQKRGARIYAEVVGFGSGYDAYKLLTPHPEGRGLSLAMQAALRDADSSPRDIGYIAAHGSATRLGDPSEARAIRSLFDSALDGLVASSVKPATGHTVGAAGALNVAVAALSLYHQVVPPTLNLEEPDADCNYVDWVPGQAREVHIDQALALARGMEGQNVALAMRRPTGVGAPLE